MQMLASQYESFATARRSGSMIGVLFKRIITIAEQLGSTLEQTDVNSLQRQACRFAIDRVPSKPATMMFLPALAKRRIRMPWERSIT